MKNVILLFLLFLCGCKTQKSTCLINEVNKGNTQTELSKFEAIVDTTKTFRIDIDKSKLKIRETITTKKYDKDTGAITEETKAEREVTQDSDKVYNEEINQAVTNSNRLEVDHNTDVSKKVGSEIEEESIGGQEAFGKWFGMVFGLVIGMILLYLLRKIRVN